MQVPTMREMAALEPAPDESQATSSGAVWEWRHRMLLLGAVLTAAALGAGVWFFLKRPIAPIDTVDADKIQQTAKDLSPVQTWHFWNLMKQGLDRRIDQQYADRMTIYYLKQTFIGILALAGIALIGAGVAVGKKK
jgi:heme A synthase